MSGKGSISRMSDETGNGVSVLYCVSGCYAEVHISWLNLLSVNIDTRYMCSHLSKARTTYQAYIAGSYNCYIHAYKLLIERISDER